MNIDLLGVGLLLDTETDLKVTALVICAVPTSKLAFPNNLRVSALTSS